MSFSNATAFRIVEHLTTAVLLFDKDLHLIWINNAGENLLSVSNKRVQGLLPKQIWPKSSFFYEAIYRSLHKGTICIEHGVEIHLSADRKVKVDCMITTIMQDEMPTEILVEMIDTNTLVRAMQEINQQTVQEVTKESIQGIAHEIKNPLGGIRGAAQLLEHELEDKKFHEYTEIIISETDRLRHFIDHMLTTSSRPIKSKMNIHEVLEYVISIIQAEHIYPLKIKKDYDPSIPEIKADRGQIVQALLNLIQNAAQAIDKDSGEINLITRVQRQVTIQHKLNRHIIKLDIVDNGPGVPPEIETDIFYPMITSRLEGTGLGLSIAQQLVQSHGGLIKHERKDYVTCFTVLFPMEQVDE